MVLLTYNPYKEKHTDMIKHKLGYLTLLSTFFIFQLVSVSALSSTAYAGGTIQIDNTHSVSIGMGLRSSFNIVENDAPNGTSDSKDFVLDSFRSYLSGQLHEIVTFEFNADFESKGTEHVRVLDAVLKFAFNDLFQVWTGRFLPPSDRSNLSGPYYLNAWSFPFVQAYPNVFSGRDDGLAIFGQVDGGKFKYQVGAFEGKEATSDSLLYAGRLTLNLWDPEPGYYNSSTYYGGKNVLAIGFVAMTQSNAAGKAAGTAGDFTGWSADLLVERNLQASGVATLEGAFYNYDGDNVGAATVGGTEGDGYFLLGSFLLPNKIGSGILEGQIQPMVRYQEFSNEGLATGDHTRLDLAVSHIVNGHNGRITLTYSTDESASGVDKDMIILGIQFQA